MAGKPIVHAANALSNYIKAYKCGVSVESESTKALVEGIETVKIESG